jgi:cyclomaltodextrinase
VLLQATLPGAPCLYYGDEVGLEVGIDPESLRSFPWDEGRWDQELLGSVRATFAMRHAEPALRSDEVALSSAAGKALAFRRGGASGSLAVAVNAGEEPVRVLLGSTGAPFAGVVGASVLHTVGRARTSAPSLSMADGDLAADLPPRSGAVIRLG